MCLGVNLISLERREMACVNDVTDSLKSCSKIYYLKQGENEVSK